MSNNATLKSIQNLLPTIGNATPKSNPNLLCDGQYHSKINPKFTLWLTMPLSNQSKINSVIGNATLKSVHILLLMIGSATLKSNQFTWMVLQNVFPILTTWFSVHYLWDGSPHLMQDGSWRWRHLVYIYNNIFCAWTTCLSLNFLKINSSR